MTDRSTVRPSLEKALKGLVVGCILLLAFQRYVASPIGVGTFVFQSHAYTASVAGVSVNYVPLLFVGQGIVGIVASYAAGGRSGLAAYLLCVPIAAIAFALLQYVMGHVVGGVLVLLAAGLLRNTGLRRTFSDRDGVRMQGRS